VNDYLGSGRLSSPAWDPAAATVRRVATHTAGLATYDLGWSPDQGLCPSVDEIIRRYGVLIWRPGEQFDDSNLGYGILGEVLNGAVTTSGMGPRLSYWVELKRE
jgi:CubicO group peptidase (beta-lactamase class C family)